MVNIDTRLIDIFLEMVLVKNTSRAAESLDLSQPSVSMGLARLREYYGDPLFVRTSTGMEPTPRAIELLPLLQQARQAISESLRTQDNFDPIRSDRRFRICTSDAGRMLFLPALLSHLQQNAPSVRIETPAAWGNLPEQLKNGEYELAIAHIPRPESGIVRKRLYDEQYVCCVAVEHPRISSSISMDAYANERHIVVTPTGPGNGVLSNYLRNVGIDRKVGIVLPGYSAVAEILGETDLVATVPRKVALVLSRSIPLQILPLPFPSPSYIIAQYWHERYSKDSGLVWIRNLIAEIFSGSAAKHQTRVEREGSIS
ncbi:LysR family transcriptional regulator [Bordetella petrii]|nr:LysR family transcriptional regulator [Bordetella petrii]